MKTYIDSNFCCHTSNAEESYREFDVPFFDLDLLVGSYVEVVNGNN